METLEQKIERFKEHYFGLIDVAESEVNLANQKIHSKILCCSIFDAISKSVFPEIKSNCKRFTSLVRLCTDWQDSEKVSILHLLRLLEITPNLSHEAQELKSYITKKYSKMFVPTNCLISNNFSISYDLDIKELLELWPTESGDAVKIGDVKPHQLKHEYMLWLYRNSLVHEYRNPGNGVELGQHVPDYAFYQEVSTVHSLEGAKLQFTNHWELVYPSKFFLNLCKNAVEVACEFHRVHETCPFNGYSGGTYWLPEFNE